MDCSVSKTLELTRLNFRVFHKVIRKLILFIVMLVAKHFPNKNFAFLV